MCGIAGFTKTGGDAKTILAAMAETLERRGPDGSGFHVSKKIALGHRRLAVIDLEGGAQPKVDEKSGDALIFNGEIYGYLDLAGELRRDGVLLDGHSDTEVLFRMIQRLGVAAALERLDGMFAFAFFEGRTSRLYLARDRFGEKPLFYGIQGGGIVFASEIKAMRRHPAFRHVNLDREAVHQYLTYEYVPSDRSGFEGIKKLRPGHLLVFDNGEAQISAYWRPVHGGAAKDLKIGQAIDRLDELLQESIRQRLIADVPVGLFLSGGVDSGLLAAIAARQSAKITAFTVKMPDSTYDETPIAASIARHCGMPHQVVALGLSDVMEAFLAVSAMIDEPLADYSLLPTYLVCRAARKTMTVALGGDGGDELFAGYSSFKALRFANLMSFIPSAFGALLRSALDLLPAGSGYMSLDFILRHVSQGFGHPVDCQNALWMAAFTEQEKTALWKKEELPANAALLTFQPVIEALSQSAPKGKLERLLHAFTTTYLPDDILAKVDRAAMQNSLETRSPYLARAFAEYAMSLPARWKFKGGQTKYILRKLAERYLPKDIINRPKHGFGLPLSSLLRGPLAMPVQDVLLDRTNRAASWFERTMIETLIRQHQQGRRDHRKKLWALYILFKAAA